MKLILSNKDLSGYVFPEDVGVIYVSLKQLSAYNHNTDVVAIAGSRAMAIEAEKMDLPSLKLIQLTSAGFDGVPCEEYANRNVAVANAGTTYSVPIAETVVFGILFMTKKIRKNPNNRHFKLFRHYSTITELDNKSALIMGAGNIGTAIADRLRGFGIAIDAYDPFCPEKPQYRNIIRDRETLEAAIGEYDFVISTMPDNETTRGFIDKKLFDKMSSRAVIVNVGRKAVFNNEDFYQSLKKKQIAGAVLDIFEKVPNPITNKFRRLSNVVVLPGVSAISQEVNDRLKQHIYKNLLAMLKDDMVLNVINGV